MTSQSVGMRHCEEHDFKSFDGTSLFYRYWPGDGNSRKAIVLFHRGHEHGGRMAHLVDELQLPEYSFFAWDARGLGRSSGVRGYAESVGVLAKDVDTFVRHISERFGIAIADIAVIAQSVGAVVIAAWVHDYAPPIRCMVLASPAFKVKLYVPFARTGLRLLQKIRKGTFVNSYVKARYLTHSPERIASYNADPLITRPIAVNLLLDLYDTAERTIADAETISVPTQLLISGADWVVHRAPQRTFFNRISSHEKEAHVLEGFYHDTFGEQERHQATTLTRAFVWRQFNAPQQVRDWREADQHGTTKDEFDRLSARPASIIARAYWAMSRFWIGVGALISEGLALSARTGFDSGSTLDYVYRNTAQGRGWLGKCIDRIYLDSVGWRGIRVRKMHLEASIRCAINKLLAVGLPVKVVDIAAGHGRYILDALASQREKIARIQLRDYSPLNVDAGRTLIRTYGLEGIATFEEG